MVKEEIVEGLRLAIYKGESLEKAMTTFFNAGYTREDIEEAAHFIQSAQGFGQAAAQPRQTQQPVQKPVQPTVQPTSQPPARQPEVQYQAPQPTYQPLNQQQPNYSGVVQRVSSYGSRPEQVTSTIITILLFIALLMLFGVLAAVLIWKDELSQFFNGLFWLNLF